MASQQVQSLLDDAVRGLHSASTDRLLPEALRTNAAKGKRRASRIVPARLPAELPSGRTISTVGSAFGAERLQQLKMLFDGRENATQIMALQIVALGDCEDYRPQSHVVRV